MKYIITPFQRLEDCIGDDGGDDDVDGDDDDDGDGDDDVDRDDDALPASIVDRRLVEASGALLPFSHLTSTHCIWLAS